MSHYLKDGNLKARPPRLKAYHDRTWALANRTGVQKGPEVTLDAFYRDRLEIFAVCEDGSLGLMCGTDTHLSYNGAAAYDSDSAGDLGGDYGPGQSFLFSSNYNPDGLDWIDGRRTPFSLRVIFNSFFRQGNTFMFSGYFQVRSTHRSQGGSINVWRENASYPIIRFVADPRTSVGAFKFFQYGWESS